jgi:hypothetical protein
MTNFLPLFSVNRIHKGEKIHLLLLSSYLPMRGLCLVADTPSLTLAALYSITTLQAVLHPIVFPSRWLSQSSIAAAIKH